MDLPDRPAHSYLRLRALLLGTGVFLLFAMATVFLATFVRQHQATEAAHRLDQDSFELKQRLESGLSERVTVLKQAVSFFLFSKDVDREEFRGYARRLLADRPHLFFNLSYSGPDFKLVMAEPEELTRGVIGLDHSKDPYRYPHMNREEITDEVVIGGVYRLLAAKRDGFCIIAPIFKDGAFNGFVTGTVVLDQLFSQLFPETVRGSRHITIVDIDRHQALFDAGAAIDASTALKRTALVRFQGLNWEVMMWAYPNDGPIIATPSRIVLIIGLLAAVAMGTALGSLWLGKQRLRASEYDLRQHANELEQTNKQLEDASRRKEEAITLLEGANARLAATNAKLEVVNDELAQANAQLRDLNKELDDFNHVVSHDLKEPLRGIQAFSQFLLEDYGDKLDEMGQSYLENLMSSASRMQQLINDLMQLARVTKSRSTRDIVDMDMVFRNATQDLSYALQSRHAVLELPGELPRVWGDLTHLLIVVKNLLSNALKYNDKPQPRITVTWVDHGDEVEFRLQDNGIGIDPRYHKRIFELFERLVTQEEYEGTGAGLAISKKIIEQHGGRIWVESKPGQGSTFCFTLPRVRAGQAA